MHLLRHLLQQDRRLPAQLRQGGIRQEVPNPWGLDLGRDLVPPEHQGKTAGGRLPHGQEETPEEEKEQEQTEKHRPTSGGKIRLQFPPGAAVPFHVFTDASGAAVQAQG